jgi:hypothetical protein
MDVALMPRTPRVTFSIYGLASPFLININKRRITVQTMFIDRWSATVCILLNFGVFFPGFGD